MMASNLWQGRGDVKCNAAATTKGQREVLCRDPSYLMNNGFVLKPTFIVQSDIDTHQLSREGSSACPYFENCPGNVTAADQDKMRAYDTAFALNLLQRAMTTQMTTPTAGIIIQYPKHVMACNYSFTAPFTSASGASATIADLFGKWYRNPCAQAGEAFVVGQSGIGDQFSSSGFCGQ